jgi:hypothetical protein
MNMIKASEAKAMVKEYHEKKEAELNARVEKFLNTECETAITTAAMNGQQNCFVEVPRGLAEDTARITARLNVEGYKAQTRFGVTPAILIMW